MLRATISGNKMNPAINATEPTILAKLTSTAGQVSRARLLIHSNYIPTDNTEGILITTEAATTPAFDVTLTNNHVDVD